MSRVGVLSSTDTFREDIGDGMSAVDETSDRLFVCESRDGSSK